VAASAAKTAEVIFIVGTPVLKKSGAGTDKLPRLGWGQNRDRILPPNPKAVNADKTTLAARRASPSMLLSKRRTPFGPEPDSCISSLMPYALKNLATAA
jgi:hypothetical protein